MQTLAGLGSPEATGGWAPGASRGRKGQLFREERVVQSQEASKLSELGSSLDLVA